MHELFANFKVKYQVYEVPLSSSKIENGRLSHDDAFPEQGSRHVLLV